MKKLREKSSEAFCNIMSNVCDREAEGGLEWTDSVTVKLNAELLAMFCENCRNFLT